MKIKGVTIPELQEALDRLNERYDANITFEYPPVWTTRTTISANLRVKDTKGAGTHISAPPKRRRCIQACWHAHGHFFDILLEIQPKAVIETFVKIYKDETGTVQGNWTDRDRGYPSHPFKHSECCECDS